MAFKKSFNSSKHTLKERRAYNVGYALGITGLHSDALSVMYDERNGTVGKSSKEVLASLKGFNRGAKRYDKSKR